MYFRSYSVVLQMCGFRSVNVGVLGVFVGRFRSVHWVFTERSQRIGSLYVTFSSFKSMVFAIQKYGFWRTKVWFLQCKKWVFGIRIQGYCKTLMYK